MRDRTALGLAVLRVVLGFAFFMHGWQKLFMMGIPGVTGFFGQVGVPAPAVAAVVISVLELAGGLALILGLGTRYVAAALIVDMLGAFFLVHLENGFYGPNGFELVLILTAGLITLILAGPGAFAVDRRLRGLASRSMAGSRS